MDQKKKNAVTKLFFALINFVFISKLQRKNFLPHWARCWNYHLIHYSEVKKNMVAHEACIYQSSRLAEIILAIGNILHILKQSEWNYLYSGLLKALHSSFVSHFLSDIFKSCYWKATNKNKNIKFPVVSCECEKQPQKISKISVLFKIPWSFLACHF